MTDTTKNDQSQVLAQLGEVKGQLQLIATLIHNQHQATNQRIDDLRTSVEGRFTGLEDRLSTLEKNERSTALRTASMSALGGALGGAIVNAALKTLGH